ncbi:beta-aspartyl-peptidase [Faecalicoccus pleomorphus]|uniref:beta-aspartyl-peptidase n=1 Tax=Faecalicoccus pleomorphus TaxID=1323 RepID=UPI001897DD02|nr:beta-aspartyl-peptidase [Faecalicoccus pleomorphus]MDB7985313.1 beta-aspartyl-peptidase [Faecalicoccus pleomorphus]
MLQIKNAQVYAPQDKGIQDVWIAGGKIEAVSKTLPIINGIDCIDATGKILTPGLIDRHVHITGGGGEGGFCTQAPAVTASRLIHGGLTTVVGLLGTDGVTRSVENLVAKAKGLKDQGISVYCMTGAYGYPSTTITDSVQKDIVFVEEIIGCKLALSDHRSSHVTSEELMHLASDVRVAGMLSKKAGILTLHLGDEKQGLQMVMDILDQTDIPIKTFQPTHVNRNLALLQQAIGFAKRGGTIDITCDSTEGVYQALMKIKEEGVCMDQVTLSSDGQGSWSKYDARGNLLQIGVSYVDTIYKQIVYLVKQKNWSMEDALALGCRNVAKALELYPQKGVIQKGSDADLLLWDKDLNLDTVIAQGNILMKNGKLLTKEMF